MLLGVMQVLHLVLCRVSSAPWCYASVTPCVMQGVECSFELMTSGVIPLQSVKV